MAGFQSYQVRQEISLDPDLTFLVGRNNVGKSAFLRALRAFADPTEYVQPGLDVTYTWHVTSDVIVNQLDPKLGAAVKEIGSYPAHELVASYVAAQTPGTQQAAMYCYRLELPELGWHAEGQVGYKAGWNSGPWKQSSTGFQELEQLVRRWVTAVELIAPRRVDQGRRGLYPQSRLAPEARNLTEVLFDLQLNKPSGTFRDLIAFMKEAFPEIDTITVRTPSDESSPMGEIHIIYGNTSQSVPLRLCGTGVEQMLALGTAVLNAGSPRLVLIDEPQAYLHPHAERSLLSLVEAHPEHQYVVATHSGLLLNARPISHSRLITIENGSSRISDPDSDSGILTELGIGPADLWLPDRLLWVEGASDETVFRTLLKEEVDPASAAGLRIRPMPESSRFTGRTRRHADAAYRFCKEVADAVSPLSVEMLFLFDRDEKDSSIMDAISEASSNRARFLPVREIENLFLDVDVLHAAVTHRAETLEQAPPSRSEVQTFLAQLLAAAGDRRLFPSPPRQPESAVVDVRGSAVLDEMFWRYTTSRYDKIRDAKLLTELALQHAPHVLDPLRAVLTEFALQRQTVN